MEIEIYKEIGVHEVQLTGTVEMCDEGYEPESPYWVAMLTSEIGFDESLYNKAMCVAIESYIEENEDIITREMEEDFSN